MTDKAIISRGANIEYEINIMQAVVAIQKEIRWII